MSETPKPEDKKPAPPRPAPTPAAKEAPPAPKVDGIPVALLRFERAIQYPGRGSDSQVKTEKATNGQTWTVDYLPNIRHFRIVHTNPSHQKPELRRVVGYVPECRALSWEPVP